MIKNDIYLNGTIMEEETMEMTKNNPSFQIENSITKGNVEKIKQIHLLLEEIWK
jgi:flagellar basal body rod protein FlgB